MCMYQITQKSFVLPCNIPLKKKLADNQCSSVSKGSILSNIMSIQPFTMGVDWPDWTFNGSVYYVWYLHILLLLRTPDLVKHVLSRASMWQELLSSFIYVRVYVPNTHITYNHIWCCFKMSKRRPLLRILEH